MFSKVIEENLPLDSGENNSLAATFTHLGPLSASLRVEASGRETPVFSRIARHISVRLLTF
jgi:hypothetical protein